jgi:hypothetical protein
VRTLPSVVLLSAAAVIACSDGTSPDVNDEESLEQVLSELGTVGTYAGAGLAGAGVGFTGVSAPPPEVCAFDAVTEYFVCAERTMEGVTFNRRYQLLDAGGSLLSSFDPATVSGIRNVTDLSGTMQREHPAGGGVVTFTIESHDEQTLTGLRTATRTLNGSGTSEHTMTLGEETVTTTATRTTENLVLPAAPGPGTYPASGVITTTASSQQMTFTSTMTFNGTSAVTIVVTMNGVSHTCTYDLANRMSPPVCS